MPLCAVNHLRGNGLRGLFPALCLQAQDHTNDKLRTLVLLRMYLNGAIGCGKLDGIRQQIQHRLIQTGLVAEQMISPGKDLGR